MLLQVVTLITKASVFPTGGMGGSPPPPAKNLLIPPPCLEKLPSSSFPLQIFIPTPPQVNFPAPLTKEKISSHNPIKTAFVAVVIAPVPFLF